MRSVRGGLGGARRAFLGLGRAVGMATAAKDGLGSAAARSDFPSPPFFRNHANMAVAPTRTTAPATQSPTTIPMEAASASGSASLLLSMHAVVSEYAPTSAQVMPRHAYVDSIAALTAGKPPAIGVVAAMSRFVLIVAAACVKVAASSHVR